MTHDTVERPVRCGDTRVLPALLAALTESQRSHFLGPLARRWSPARDGVLLRWDDIAEQPASAGFEKLPLSDEVFTTLCGGSRFGHVWTLRKPTRLVLSEQSSGVPFTY